MCASAAQGWKGASGANLGSPGAEKPDKGLGEPVPLALEPTGAGVKSGSTETIPDSTALEPLLTILLS